MARGAKRGAQRPPVARRQVGRSPAAATPVSPWTLPERPYPGGPERFGPPPEEEPPALTDLRGKLTRGRVRVPRVPSTVTRGPASPRVEQALRTIVHFEATGTDATAYDATIAAGPVHLLVAVNFKVVVLSKGGGSPLAQCDLRAWFDAVLPREVDTVFDPRVLYDQYENRWVLAASAVHYGDLDVGDEFTLPHLVLSVSRTSDPTGDWWTWSFPERTRRAKTPWPDHPSLGLDPHALYLSANLIGGAGPRLRIMPKAAAYAGGVVTYTDFDALQNPTDKPHPTPTPASTVFPCHTWGAPGVQYLVSTRRDTHNVEGSIVLWTVENPGTRPALAPPRLIPVPPYPIGVPLVTQKGGPGIVAGDARVRNAVFNGGSVWLAFATTHTGSPNVGAARWYQVDPVGPRVLQNGNFAVGKVHHCYPAIVPDMHGNATFVIGRSSPKEFVSLHLSARRAGDRPGELPPSTAVHLGDTGHDNPDRYGNNRWGDYHAAALDPDGVTVWVCGASPVTPKTWRLCVASVRV